MAPTPPDARPAPAQPWRASMTREGTADMAPTPPDARPAPAQPWRASMTREERR
jgi:hypothetical protein